MLSMESEEHLEQWCLSSQVPQDGPCSPGGAELLPAHGNGCFALLECLTFAFPAKLSLPQPMSVLTFTFPIHTLILLVGESVSGPKCGAWLLDGVKPQQLSGPNPLAKSEGDFQALSSYSSVTAQHHSRIMLPHGLEWKSDTLPQG